MAISLLLGWRKGSGDLPPPKLNDITTQITRLFCFIIIEHSPIGYTAK